MKKFFADTLLSFLSSSPLCCILLLLVIGLLIIFVLLLLRKQIGDAVKHFLAKYSNGAKISWRKEQRFTVSPHIEERPGVEGPDITNIEMEQSEIHSVKGQVVMDNIKMKDSYIGDIRSD